LFISNFSCGINEFFSRPEVANKNCKKYLFTLTKNNNIRHMVHHKRALRERKNELVTKTCY
jgi:hypothetical protein